MDDQMNLSAIAVDTAIGQVKQHYRALGLRLPKKLTDTLTRIDEQKNRPVTTKPDPAVLRDAVDKALDEGRDPVDDETVQRELRRRQLVGTNVHVDLLNLADQRRAALLREHSAAIIGDLTNVVEEADAALDQARQKLPDLDLTDPRQATLLPPGQMSTWGYARDAAANVERAVQAWHQVVHACRLAPQSGNRMPLILADLTPAEFEALGTTNAMAPVHAGHRLSLATPAEYIARCKRIDDDTADRAARHQRELRTGRPEGASVATL